MSDELYIEENLPWSKNHGDVWAVLTDKVYLGMEREIRSFSPRKKPGNHKLSFAELDFDKNHSIDRFIVYIFFGIMGTIWPVMGKKNQG